MKTASAVEFEVLKEKEMKLGPSHEAVVPTWRHRLRWWRTWPTWLMTKSSMVRLVGPNKRPLERHEFETVSKYESLRNRVL